MIKSLILLSIAGLFTLGYGLLNVGLPNAIVFAVENGYVEAPSNYSIYKPSITR